MDDWSFGIIMYKLLVGIFPFKGRNDEEYKGSILRAKLVFPENLKLSS